MGLHSRRDLEQATYQSGAIQQEGLKEREKEAGEAVSICLGKEVFLVCLHWGTQSLCLS